MRGFSTPHKPSGGRISWCVRTEGKINTELGLMNLATLHYTCINKTPEEYTIMHYTTP